MASIWSRIRLPGAFAAGAALGLLIGQQLSGKEPVLDGPVQVLDDAPPEASPGPVANRPSPQMALAGASEAGPLDVDVEAVLGSSLADAAAAMALEPPNERESPWLVAQKGMPDDAIGSGLDGEIGTALYELGQQQQAEGNLAAAIDSYKRAAAFAPERAQTFYDWGYLLERQGDFPGAIEKYRQAIALDPQHAYARNNLGYRMQTAGDLEGAIETYKGAVDAGAATPLTHYNLGFLLQQSGAEDQAMEAYRAALERAPEHAYAHYNLGWLLQKGGDDRAAIGHYRAALETAPDLEIARQTLRDVLARRLQDLRATR